MTQSQKNPILRFPATPQIAEQISAAVGRLLNDSKQHLSAAVKATGADDVHESGAQLVGLIVQWPEGRPPKSAGVSSRFYSLHVTIATIGKLRMF